MNADILDRILPLKNASHADVEHYGVDPPMRYSECYAKLVDGRIVRLRDNRQFMGWNGVNGSRRLLFADGERQIELRRNAELGFEVAELSEGARYVARDGSLQFTA